MKQYLYAAILSATALLTACDYNENFEGFVKGPQPTDIKKLEYTLTAADYKAIADNKANIAKAKAAGEEAALKAIVKTQRFTETVTAAEYLPAFLYDKWITADNGSSINVIYDSKITNGADAFVEDFESADDKTLNPAVVKDWTFKSAAGTTNWESRFRNANNYLQASAYKQADVVSVYAISPAFTPNAGMHLTLEAAYGNYVEAGGRLKVYLQEGELDVKNVDLDSVKWTKDFSKNVSIEKPTETYGTMKTALDVDLSAYKGKSVRLILRYEGNGKTGATTTVQVDNVKISNKVAIEEKGKKDQFVRVNDAWNYDPSSIVLLYPTKNATTTAYFQAGVDWVTTHIDSKLGLEKGKGYVSSYGNNEYYSGLSAFYGNVDLRASKAREQYPAGFESKSDAEVQALLEQHLQETLLGALETLHADAVPVEGIDVIYTLRIGVYTGTALAADQLTHEIKFKVIAKGKFEYVKNSYKKL